MRISSLYYTNTMRTQMGASNARISKLMEQIATQKRFSQASEDPIAARRLSQLSREQAAIEQYQSNISRISGTLGSQEAHIKSMNNQLLSLNDKLLAAANGSQGTTDFTGYGKEFASMLDSLVASLNAQNENGDYLFAGTKTDTRPVVWDSASNSYRYAGNDSSRETAVANGVTITENTHAAGAFSGSGNDLELLNKLKALSDKMQDPSIPYSSYQGEIQQMIDLTSSASNKVSGLFTDLGGRQNQLTVLDNVHADIALVNDEVSNELEQADWASASMNLQLSINALQISNKTYTMVSQLSLFSMM